jgi:hypothetical protein
LYIARLPKFSKYCCVCRSGAFASASVSAKVKPVIGCCSTPSTVVGCGIPTRSRIVGPMSVTCRNCERSPPSSLMRAGQRTTIGSRVPPRCEATCFPHANGVFPAQAHAVE